MNVLIACERFGVVREAFRSLGHHAISCDLVPDADNSPHHITGDVFDVIGSQHWDLMIAHPPCTHLAVSGSRYFAQKRADGRQQAAIDFFMKLINAPIHRICVENPVCIMSTHYRRPDQIIQPYQFGHPESKKTCLWLKNLPPLMPTHLLALPAKGYWDNCTPSGQNKLGPSEERAMLRAKTYPGIAESMANQWSDYD